MAYFSQPMLALGLLLRVSASAWKETEALYYTCGPTAGDGPEAMVPAGAAGAEDSSASERDPPWNLLHIV